MYGATEAHNCAPVYLNININISIHAAHHLFRAGRTSIVPGKELLSHLTSASTKEDLGRLGEKFVADIEAGRHKQEGWPSSMYGISKLLLSMYTRIEAKEMEGRGIMVNACCPG